jgi:DNA (cytosine-5)-methyltransferase 1
MGDLNKDVPLKCIDLFAGVGGIRLGFEQACKDFGLNAECVFTCEIDEWACKTYRKNFSNDSHDPKCDVTKVDETQLPDFDVLLAGFPCQAFSIAGKRGGFNDTRGTLFFDVARIIKEKRPKAFLLENVKGLTNHRGGKTLEVIINTLKEDLGYTVFYKVLNAKDYGLAQTRERIYIVGFRNDCGGRFAFPQPVPDSERKVIHNIMEENPVDARYYLSTVSIQSLKAHKARHQAKGNGFGYIIRSLDEVAGTIVCGGMGKERNLIVDPRQTDLTPPTHTHIKGEYNKEGLRRMTPKEWERLQGFPDDWTAGLANIHRYKQMGNSVAVPVIKAIAANIIGELTTPLPQDQEMSHPLPFPAVKFRK